MRLNVPFADLTEEEQRFVLEGEGRFPGVRGFFRKLETKKYKVHVRVFLSRYRGYTECPECHGARLRKEALYVRVGGRDAGRRRAHEHRRGPGLLRQPSNSRPRRRPSPARCWSRSASGSSS